MKKATKLKISKSLKGRFKEGDSPDYSFPKGYFDRKAPKKTKRERVEDKLEEILMNVYYQNTKPDEAIDDITAIFDDE